MLRFFRTHPGTAALAAVLLACFAAPYLIPTDPDSAVFRGGMLPSLLLLVSYFPIKTAFRHLRQSAFLPCLFFAVAFSFSLSLGAELSFYNGLLPGLRSMIRRFAVPLFSTPLFFGLIMRLILLPVPTGKALRLPFVIWFVLLLLCWSPVLLAYWPGMLNYDFMTERSFFNQGLYSQRNPLLYLFLNNFLLSAGASFSNTNIGLLLSTVFMHMLPLAAALAYSLRFAERHDIPASLQIPLFVFYALHPMFSVLSISQSKDVPFAAALLVLSLLSWEMLRDQDSFFSSRGKRICFVLMTVFTIHMRKNGIAAILLLFPALILSLHKQRMRIIRLTGISVLLSAFGLAAFELIPLDRQPYFQYLSIPAQQLVRAYRSDKLSEEEKAEIESWYFDKQGLILNPRLADGAKAYLMEERLEPELRNYLNLWFRIGKKCPREYIEAFLLLNIGSWYPDDKTHAHIYAFTGASRKGYLELNEYKSREFTPTTFFPTLRDIIEEVCRYRAYQKYPIISTFFAIATPFWMLILACILFRAHGQKPLRVAAFGPLGVWFSYLFGPCALPRYALPLFCLAPLLLLLAFGAKKYQATTTNL